MRRYWLYTVLAAVFLLGACGLRNDIGSIIDEKSKVSSTPLLALLVVRANSRTRVDVTFSRSAERTSAETAFNYSIPGLSVAGGARDGANNPLVGFPGNTVSLKNLNVYHALSAQ